MEDDHDFVRGKTLVIDEGQKDGSGFGTIFTSSSQSYCPVATYSSEFLIVVVKAWLQQRLLENLQV